MIVIAARPGVGKALALDTPIATPTGWTTMGEVAVGDQVIGSDGRPTTVVAATDVMTDRPCYEVHFSDGSVIVADAQHQWLTETPDRDAQAGGPDDRADRPHGPLRHRRRGPTTRSTNARRWTCPRADLPLPPYALGRVAGRTAARSRELPIPEIAAYLEADAARERGRRSSAQPPGACSRLQAHPRRLPAGVGGAAAGAAGRPAGHRRQRSTPSGVVQFAGHQPAAGRGRRGS